MKTQLTLLTIITFAFLACAQLGCDRRSTSATTRSKTVTFAQLPITYSATTQLANSRGLFGSDLKPIFVSVPAGPDVMNSLRSRAPSSPSIGGIAITPVISMIGAGDKPVILATTLVSNQRVKLVTFDSTGISDDGNSLRGKRIGIVRNTVGDIYLSRLLAEAGLTQSDVVVASGRPVDLKNLLLKGDLDAAVLWDPFVVQAVREYRRKVKDNGVPDRGKVKVLVEPGLYTLAFNVVSTQEKLKKNGDAIREFLRGIVKSGDYINQNRDEASESLEQWLKLEDDDLKDFVHTTDFKVHLDVPQVKQWLKEEGDWLISVNKEAKIPVDFSQYVDATLLNEINSELVSDE